MIVAFGQSQGSKMRKFEDSSLTSPLTSRRLPYFRSQLPAASKTIQKRPDQ